MIGFERMLHAQQKPQPQNSEHTPPNPLCASTKCQAKALPGQQGMDQRYWRVALIVVTDVPELVGLLPVA